VGIPAIRLRSATFFATWSSAFERSQPLIDVCVLVEPWALDRLRHAVDTRCRDAIPDAIDQPERLVVGFERLEYAEWGLLGLGPGIEVIDPPELRARMAEVAAATAARYAPSCPTQELPTGRRGRCAVSAPGFAP
jgi:hypothetical protein